MGIWREGRAERPVRCSCWPGHDRPVQLASATAVSCVMRRGPRAGMERAARLTARLVRVEVLAGDEPPRFFIPSWGRRWRRRWAAPSGTLRIARPPVSCMRTGRQRGTWAPTCYGCGPQGTGGCWRGCGRRGAWRWRWAPRRQRPGCWPGRWPSRHHLISGSSACARRRAPRSPRPGRRRTPRPERPGDLQGHAVRIRARHVGVDGRLRLV